MAREENCGVQIEGNKPKSRKNQTNTLFWLIVVGQFTFLYEPHTLFGIPVPAIKAFFHNSLQFAWFFFSCLHCSFYFIWANLTCISIPRLHVIYALKLSMISLNEFLPLGSHSTFILSLHVTLFMRHSHCDPVLSSNDLLSFSCASHHARYLGQEVRRGFR